ncbi:hypothetical protein JCM13580A_28800 [Streptomyces drozdowiczii]|uniref:class I adenylate-forming enzyme family protein n=1 Tax=Streptomyces drozdowiczii TaxID=202862 RepID=UPI0031E8F658
MNGTGLLDAVRSGGGAPDTPAIIGSRGEITFRQLLTAAEGFARHLETHRTPDTLVVARVADVTARAVVTLAADLVGLPVLHADPNSPVEYSGLVVHDVTSYRNADGFTRWPGADCPPLWTGRVGDRRELTGVPERSHTFLTSGSTGLPTGVVRPVEKVLVDCARIADHLGYTPGSTVVASTLAFHSYGFTYGLIAPLVRGATARHCPSRSVPSQLARAVHKHRAAHLVGLPFQLQLLASAPEADPGLATLRRVVSSGAPLPAEIGRALTRRYGFTLENGYGSSETGAISLARVGEDFVAGDVGRPLPGIEARLDPAVAVDDSRELLLRTDSLAAGYLGPHGLLPLRVDEGGWYRTGDLALADDSGRLRLKGRVGNVINVAGKKVSPGEVESALEAHPAVAEAQVLGEPDPIRGQVPVARVVTRVPVDTADLLAWCQDRLSAHQLPRRIDLLSELPRSATGKVVRDLV